MPDNRKIDSPTLPERLSVFFSTPHKLFGFLVVFAGISIIVAFVQLRHTLSAPFTVNELSDQVSFLNDTAQISDTITANTDSDGDGLDDQTELNVYRTSPYLSDSDSDGFSDSQEVNSGDDPLCPRGQDCGIATTNTQTEAEQVQELFPGLEPPGDETASLIQSIRVGLVTGGLDQQTVDSLSDDEILELVNASSDLQAAAGVQTTTPSAAELRQLLLDNGIDPAVVDVYTDAELIQLFNENSQ